MDQPLATFEIREKYLLVVGHGRRDNLLTMADAAGQIVRKAVETNRDLMLVDYRKLEINVHMGDAFNIVKNYEQNQPELRKIIVAAVFEPKDLSFANFWKEVGRKRGFRIEIFEDIDEAERWLLSKSEK
jgi:hypothetical protein